MLGKFAVITGPVLMSAAGLFARSLGFSSSAASRIGMSSIAVLFLAGGVLLFFVNENKARTEGILLSG